jgi:hypothetical protein
MGLEPDDGGEPVSRRYFPPPGAMPVARLTARPPSRNAVTAFWGPRVGERAANYLWWSSAVIALGPSAALAAFVIIGIPAFLHLGLASPLAWTLAPACSLWAASGVASFFLARRSASKTLGVKITSRNNPPRERSAYIAWCDKNGLPPFQALE